MKKNLEIPIILWFLLIFKPVQAQFFIKDYNKSRHVENNTGGYTEVSFVGTGDIQLALKEGKGIAANTGLGVLFWRIWDNDRELQMDIKINVASTVDSLSAFKKDNIIDGSRVFGSALLAPSTNGQGTNLNSLWYLNDTRHGSRRLFIDGLQVSVLASNQIWQMKTSRISQTTGNEEISIKAKDASIFFLRAGIFHEFIRQDTRRAAGYSIRLGINYNLRSVQGDLGRPVNADFRSELLGTKKKSFQGGEFLLSVRLRNIRAEASLPILNYKKGEPVAGLSGTQFATSIAFVGGFNLPLN